MMLSHVGELERPEQLLGPFRRLFPPRRGIGLVPLGVP